MRRFRRWNRLRAWLGGYFWLPCPICGEMFGGHEIGTVDVWDGRGNHVRACWRHRDDWREARVAFSEGRSAYDPDNDDPGRLEHRGKAAGVNGLTAPGSGDDG